MSEAKKRNPFRKLDIRLMAIVCLAVIPINILAILLSNMVVQKSREQLDESYAAEFDVYVSREMGQFGRVDGWYADFLQKYLPDFTNSRRFSAVSSINIVNEAVRTLDLYGIRALVFLEEKQGDEKLFLKGSQNMYPYEWYEALRKEFMGMNGKLPSNSPWQILELGGRFFFVRYFSYQNYDFGIGIDIGESLRIWTGIGSEDDSRILVYDAGTIVVCNGSGDVSSVTDMEWEDYLEANRTWRVVEEVECAVPSATVVLLKKGGWIEVPHTYFVLQIIAWLGLLVLAALWWIIRRQVISPLRILQTALKELDAQEWYYRIEAKARTEEYDYIYREFNKMADDILRSHEKDILLYETQLNNLKLQVNPHMLLNSLTTIYSLAETAQYRVIQKLTMNMVGYFRYCLRENNTLVALKSEMQFVDNYLEIQKIRYPGEISSVYTMDDDLGKALIPPLLVQNFVENATKYARIPGQTIEILINIRREAERLLISVSDTGKGMEEDLVHCLNSGESYIDRDGLRHIGVWNCRKRLEAFYGSRAQLHISSETGAGTQVWIELPLLCEVETAGRRHL